VAAPGRRRCEARRPVRRRRFAVARAGRAVSLFESDQPSVAAVGRRRPKIGGNRVTVERRDLFRNPLLDKELERFDAVVLDPPRAGAARRSPSWRARRSRAWSMPRAIPAASRATRGTAGGGYRLEKLKAIDQFLWSGHVELVALFGK
jgi:23S rRNA (uracil1939-C5)-methyltransferase